MAWLASLIVPIRRHRGQEGFWRRLHVLVQKYLAVPVENAQVHGAGVQADAAIVLVGVCVESH
jgi:hypothetical protein